MPEIICFSFWHLWPGKGGPMVEQCYDSLSPTNAATSEQALSVQCAQLLGLQFLKFWYNLPLHIFWVKYKRYLGMCSFKGLFFLLFRVVNVVNNFYSLDCKLEEKWRIFYFYLLLKSKFHCKKLINRFQTNLRYSPLEGAVPHETLQQALDPAFWQNFWTVW